MVLVLVLVLVLVIVIVIVIVFAFAVAFVIELFYLQVFPRIPYFWSADHIYTVAGKLGPVRQDTLQFTAEQLRDITSKDLETISLTSIKLNRNESPMVIINSWINFLQYCLHHFKWCIFSWKINPPCQQHSWKSFLSWTILSLSNLLFSLSKEIKRNHRRSRIRGRIRRKKKNNQQLNLQYQLHCLNLNIFLLFLTA